MLVSCDAKALEWLVATWLSKDETATTEIINNVDQHTDNQIKFKLPGWELAQAGKTGEKEAKDGRLIAKTFVFRLIYLVLAIHPFLEKNIS